MSAIDIMVNEHKNIKRVLNVIRKLCFKVLNKQEVDINMFYKAIDFVRNYADKHHHNKEEEILFKMMSVELKGKIGEGPIIGMLTEHDQGRLFIRNLENSVRSVLEGNEEAKLDLIANAICYTDLLNRHIDKEDNVIYKFGEENLSEESLIKLEEECKKVEKIAQDNNIQSRYLKLIEELEDYVVTLTID